MNGKRRVDALDAVRSATARVHAAEQDRDRAVARAIHWGATWSQIGEALGVSAQAAHRRFRNIRYDTKTGKTWRELTLPM